MSRWFRKPRYIRHVECSNCGRVMICELLSSAYGRRIWQCEDGHVFDDQV